MKRKSPFHNSWRHSAHFDSRTMSKTTRSLVSDGDWCSSGFIASVGYLSVRKGPFATAAERLCSAPVHRSKTRSSALASLQAISQMPQQNYAATEVGIPRKL